MHEDDVIAKLLEPPSTRIHPCPICGKDGLTEETYPHHFTACARPMREARLREVTENPTEEDLKHRRRDEHARRPHDDLHHIPRALHPEHVVAAAESVASEKADEEAVTADPNPMTSPRKRRRPA